VRDGRSCFAKLIANLILSIDAQGGFIVRKILNVSASIFVAIQFLILLAAAPAVAISADLAKKCHEMAIKAHPPARPGTKPYRQAERDFFDACVAKNGQMQDATPQKDPHSDKQ